MGWVIGEYGEIHVPDTVYPGLTAPRTIHAIVNRTGPATAPTASFCGQRASAFPVEPGRCWGVVCVAVMYVIVGLQLVVVQLDVPETSVRFSTMMTKIRRSALALAILGLLEDGPLHPYGMQQLIKRWRKDEVINVGQRATLYKVINRLSDAGLIKPTGTSRDHSYPERTSYELTDAGRAVRRQWMAEVLSTPRNEFPEFPAGLSFLPLLTPEYVAELLKARRELLVQRLAQRDALITSVGFPLPRATMLETEYLHATTEAEIGWLDNVLAGLDDGSITWSPREMREADAQLRS
jgi:DNA-binding PadR family transcriptional regulator